MSSGQNGAERPNKKSAVVPRSAARLAAVQALYQMDLAQTDLTDVISEFSVHRMQELADTQTQPRFDNAFFTSLLRGVVKKQLDIDPEVNKRLATGWNLSRIDSILRAILRAGAYEIMFRLDVPAKVIINEYLNIAHAFLDEKETSVVNGVLDTLAKTGRPKEVGEQTSS